MGPLTLLLLDITTRFVSLRLKYALRGSRSFDRHGGGEINKKNIKNLLDVVGIECDEDKINKVVEELKGKNIEELLEEGSKKLASMPAAGAAPAGGAPAAAGGGAPATAAKEEKKEEPEEESDDDMGFGLFD